VAATPESLLALVNPRQPAALRAALLYRGGKADQALKLLPARRPGIPGGPGAVQSLLWRALVQCERGEFDRAAESLRQADTVAARKPPPGQPPPDWDARLEAEVVRREVEARMSKRTDPPRPR
jgi:hypothetical protein